MASIEEIRRYPIKGFGGEALRRASVAREGILYDRAVAIPSGRLSVAPYGRWTSYEAFHSLLDRPDLGRYSASVLREADENGPAILRVHRPDAEPLTLELDGDAVRIREVDGRRIELLAGDRPAAPLVTSGVPLHDVESAHLSFINLATVRALGRAAGREVSPYRFRGNIHLDGMEAWEELDLLGRRAVIGTTEIEFTDNIDRCRATSVRPESDAVDLNVPLLLSRRFGFNFCGVYARVITPGEIGSGDALRLLPETARSPRTEIGRPRWATVSSSESASTSARSVRLADALLGTAQAGQHVRVHLVDGDAPTWRSYTISRVDHEGARITVKAVESGLVSQAVHLREPGGRLIVSGPYGEAFDVAGAEPLLLLSAGIGITPTLAILDALATQGSDRPIMVVHIERASLDIAHRDELERAVRGLPHASVQIFLTGGEHAPDHGRGRPTAAFLEKLLREHRGAVAAVCGSPRFIEEIRPVLVASGIDPRSIHVDAFISPDQTPPEMRAPSDSGPFDVRLGSARTVSWRPSDGTLLDVAEAAGLQPSSGCRSGVCGSCIAPVRGAVEYLVTPTADTDEGEVVLCCAVPASDVTVELARTGRAAVQ